MHCQNQGWTLEQWTFDRLMKFVRLTFLNLAFVWAGPASIFQLRQCRTLAFMFCDNFHNTAITNANVMRNALAVVLTLTDRHEN